MTTPGRRIEDPQEILRVARDAKRVAVLGIKTEAQRGQPAFDVARSLQDTGMEIHPVPVYYPEVTTILGQPVVRRVVDVPGPPVDIVDVFRRPNDIPQHVDDLIAAKPKVVWFQLGIRNEEAADRLVAAGIDVIQNRCLIVERVKAGQLD
ncbi:MAG TPA: CoA-binding protein [Myxococcaceae bacterium]|nr:CoA-binding protein [Myxococcaceae bacterium]